MTIPMYKQGTYVERLMARYEVQPNGCWQWTGTPRGDTGYVICRPCRLESRRAYHRRKVERARSVESGA